MRFTITCIILVGTSFTFFLINLNKEINRHNYKQCIELSDKTDSDICDCIRRYSEDKYCN